MKKYLLRYFLLVLFFLIAGAGTSAKTKVTVKKVTVTSSTGSVAYVGRGRFCNLSSKVQVKPNKSANRKVIYKSNDKQVAKVSSKGIIHGMNTGTTTITVFSKKNKKKKASIKVVVTEPITNIRFSKRENTLNVGMEYQVIKRIIPVTGIYKTLSWSSSNPRVATVTQQGLIHAVGIGDAVISVTARDGSGVTEECLIHVVGEEVITKTSISKIETTSEKQVLVSLNRPQTLTQASFLLAVKQRGEGNFLKSINVASMKTTDNQNYQLNLESALTEGEYVQVRIPVLDGEYEIQQFIRFTHKTEQEILVKQQDFDLDCSLNMIGDYVSGIKEKSSSITANKTSNGWHLKLENNKEKKPSILIEAEDEMGFVISYRVTFQT